MSQDRSAPRGKAVRQGRPGAGGQRPASSGQRAAGRSAFGAQAGSRPGQRAAGRSAFGPRLLGRIEVARAGDTVIFRVVGLGSVRGAGALWEFAERSMSEGRSRFAVDLGECKGLDSTFLGMLVGLAQRAEERSGPDGTGSGPPRGGDNVVDPTSPKGWVAVFNCSEANRELFEIVGADRYVRFRSVAEMEPIETEPLAPARPLEKAQSLEERIEIVRRAHENLISIDRRNEERFGEFLRCLAAELAEEA